MKSLVPCVNVMEKNGSCALRRSHWIGVTLQSWEGLFDIYLDLREYVLGYAMK